MAALEADLERVRKDAEAFGQDLKALRIQKEKLEEELANAERERRQSQAQIRLLGEQLESEQEKTMQAEADLRNHVCVVYVRFILYHENALIVYSLGTSDKYRQ